MQMLLPVYPLSMLLILLRFAALVGMTAVFGRKLIPVRIRLAVALALTWFAVVHLPAEWMRHCMSINTIPALVIAAVGEILLGAAMGLVCDMFFAVLNMAGTMIGQGSSLMMARMVDPGSGEEAEIISTLLTILLTTLILLWNGHLYLIKIVTESFKVLPPGFFWFRGELLEMLVALGRDIFLWGVRFAFPVLAGGLLISVGMGLMARIAPEFNVLFLSLPIRLWAGVGLFAVFILYGHDPLYKLFEGMMQHMKYVLLGGV